MRTAEALTLAIVVFLVGLVLMRRRSEGLSSSSSAEEFAADPGASWIPGELRPAPELVMPQWAAWHALDLPSPDMEPVIEDTAPDQLSGPIAAAAASAREFVTETVPRTLGLAAPDPAPDVAALNERAFLDMIAWAEGTSGPNGYRTMFGGGLMDSLADHPRKVFPFTDKAGRQLKTTAAGRYQFLSRTWDALARRLQLPDFGPASQDAAALELIRERGALSDVRAGRVQAAVAKVAPIWASLPGAGYAQPERQLTALVARFERSGGTLEA